MCPPALRKLETYDFVFSKRCLTNISRRHRLADGQLSSPYPPSQSFSSFGAASVLCCFLPDLSNTALPMLLYYKQSIVFKSLELHPLFFSFVRRVNPVSLRPASLPSSLPSSFVLSGSLPPSFPASLPLPWLASSFLPFLAPCRPRSPLRVELQSKRLVYDLI